MLVATKKPIAIYSTASADRRMSARDTKSESCDAIKERLASKVVSVGSASASFESNRTRSTTRLRRFDVDSTRVPLAEISSAGVIIALNTSDAETGLGMRV